MNGNGLYSRLGLALALLAGFMMLSADADTFVYISLAILGIAGLALFVISPNRNDGE